MKRTVLFAWFAACALALGAPKLPDVLAPGYEALKAHDWKKAAAVFDAFIAAPSGVPEAQMPMVLAATRLRAGECHLALGDPDAARVRFEAARSTKGISAGTLMIATYKVGTAHKAAGATDKAQAAFREACAIPIPAAEMPSSIYYLRLAFQSITKATMTSAEYRALIETVLMNVPAVPENAEFLGFLKSEQEKLK